MAQSIYTIGGTVQAGHGLYVKRAADIELLELCQAGAFAYVLTARQMGKSSLMTETAARLAAAGTRTVQIDLTLIGTALSAEQWYLGLATEVADQLALATEPLAWWGARAHLGPAQRLTEFLREVVLDEVAAPVVIFVDEIDTTLSLDFTEDFYAAIRALYNARAQQPDLQRLTFVLIGVAIPGDLIKDPQRTPFNIGRQVQLSDFGANEARPFAAGLGLPPEQADAVLARVLDWTGGHPYMTQRLCAAIAEQRPEDRQAPDVDALVREIFLGERSKQDNNLQFVRDMLTRRTSDLIGVLTTYRRVLRGQVVRDDEGSLVKAHLKLAGAVRRDGDTLRVRNRIYAAAFGERWVKESLPRDYLPRRLQRLGLLAIGMLAVLATLLGLFLIGANSRNQELLQAAATAVAAGQQLQQELERSRATEAWSLINQNPERAMVLAAAAVTDTIVAPPEVIHGLYTAFNSMLYQRFEHGDEVTSVTWSPDGNHVLTASFDKTAIIWNSTSGQIEHTLTYTHGLRTASWSPDGNTIVTVSWDNVAAQLWNARTGSPERTLPANSTNTVAWSPDSRYLLTGGASGAVIAWDLRNGSQQDLTGHHGSVQSVSWSRDGRYIISGAGSQDINEKDNTIRIWKWENGKGTIIYTTPVNVDEIRAVEWSPDGRHFVSGGLDRIARIWDWDGQTATARYTLNGHNDGIWSVSWSPDGKWVLTGSRDATIRLWDAGTGRLTRTISGHTGAIYSLAWNPMTSLFISGSGDNTARIWNPFGEAVILPSDEETVLIAVWSPDGNELLFSGKDKTVRIRGRSPNASAFPIFTHDDEVTALAWRGNRIVTGSKDSTARVVDAKTYKLIVTIDAKNPILSVDISADGTQVLTGHEDGKVRIWRVSKQDTLITQPETEFTISNLPIRSVEWNANNTKFITGGEDAVAHICDIQKKECPGTFKEHTEAIYTVAWSHNEQYFLTGSRDGTTDVWLTTGALLHRLEGHTDETGPASWSPDDQMIVTGGKDRSVRLWDAASGELLNVLYGHMGIVQTVDWSPDGRQVLSAGDDGTIRLWTVDTRLVMAVLLRNICAVYHADDKRIAEAVSGWEWKGCTTILLDVDRNLREYDSMRIH